MQERVNTGLSDIEAVDPAEAREWRGEERKIGGSGEARGKGLQAVTISELNTGLYVE